MVSIISDNDKKSWRALQVRSLQTENSRLTQEIRRRDDFQSTEVENYNTSVIHSLKDFAFGSHWRKSLGLKVGSHFQVTNVKVVYDQEIDSLKTALQEWEDHCSSH